MSAIFPPDNVDSSIYTSNMHSTFSIKGNTNAYSWISFLSVRFPPKALNLIILTTLLDSYIFCILLLGWRAWTWLVDYREIYLCQVLGSRLINMLWFRLALGSGPLGLLQVLVFTSEICKQNACQLVKIFPIDIFNILYIQKIKNLS